MPLPVLDEDAAADWLLDHVAGLVAPLRFELIAAGRSNLTFRVRDATGRSWALRRPPTGHRLPSAHDMVRERRIVTALAGSDVPVARVVAGCDDESVLGAPFYVMEFVEGTVLRDEATVAAVDPPVRGRAAHALVETLARLHAVDPVAVGLGDLGRHDGYFERQIRRWRAQLEDPDARPLPVLTEVGARLAARIPPQRRVSIVHGDYRIDNVIFDPSGAVVAVLDWELCTLGDPLADVGMLVAYWREPGEPERVLARSCTHLDGFPDRRRLVEWYAEASGEDPGDLRFHEAFAYWKLACIGEGVRVRTLAGAAGGDPSGAAGLAAEVERYGKLALDLVESLPAVPEA